jgi:hypothetical protein
MGILDSFKPKENPEVSIAKDTLKLQEKGLYMQGARGNEVEELKVKKARDDLIMWQQELSDELNKLKHRLRSEVYDEEQGAWVPKTMKVKNKEGEEVTIEIPALANEIFIDYIQSQCEPFLSRNMINANFSEQRVLQMLRSTCDDYADAMADNFDQFGIEFTNANLIDRIIKNTIIAGPFRAINGFTKIKDTLIAKRIEGYIDRPDKTGGSMGSLFGGRR